MLQALWQKHSHKRTQQDLTQGN